MSDSQNTENEQQNNLCTTLTEQWKKGELPEGFYYVRDGENIIAEYLDGYFYNNAQPMTSFSGGVDEVLDHVPSYQEWQELKEAGDGLSKNMFKSLMNRFVKADEERENLAEENAQLKKLLRECRYNVETDLEDAIMCESNVDIEYFGYLLTRIDNAIGEKKDE